MKKVFAIIFFLFYCIGLAQYKQNKYNIKWINTESGLKNLNVRQSVMDNNGFLWIGTELGLFRYDGLRVKEIIDNKYLNLSKKRIFRLGKDFFDEKIYFVINSENNHYEIKENIIQCTPHKNHWKKIIYNKSQFCFSNNNKIIKHVLENPKIEEFNKNFFYTKYFSACLTSSYFYLPQKNGVLIFDKKGTVKKPALKTTENILLMQFGDLILAIDDGKITYLYNGKIINKKINVDFRLQNFIKSKNSSISNTEVFCESKNYYLKYAGSIFKIVFKNNKLFTEFLFKNPAEDISSISYSKKDNIYFVSTNTKGIAVVKPIAFNSIFFKSNVLNEAINFNYSVVEVSKDIWCSPSGWTFDRETNKQIIYDNLSDFSNNGFILPYKNSFFAQVKNGFYNLKTKKKIYDFFYLKEIKQNSIFLRGYAYYQNKLFITDGEWIYLFNSNTFKTLNSLNKKFDGKKINGIFAINNNLIILTTKGVYSYSIDAKTFTLVSGLENVNARYIKPINNNSYWVGCYGDGLFLINQNKLHKVTDINIQLTTAHAIEEDKGGNLWISTNDGLLKINKRIAMQKISTNQPLNCYKYSIEDGLLTNEFNGGGTHPSLQTKDGILGFSSMKGFVWFNPNHIPKHLFKGSIVMNEVLVDDKKNISLINNSYFIPEEASFITFNFNFGYYYNRQNLTVTYRFEDQNIWTEIKGNSFQIARYKKGQHKLYIKINTHGFNIENDVTQSFSINFEARYYEMWWFWGICFFFFVIFIFIAYSIGLYISKKTKDKLKIKIEEKTSELRSTVLELESSKISITESLNEKNILLKEIHHRVKNNLQLVMSILNIQASDNENKSIEGFIEKGQSRIASMVLIHENLYQKEDIGNIDLETYTESLVKNIIATFGEVYNRITVQINMKNIFFDIQTSIPLGLIINELVTNSFKHGFPNSKKGQITISIEHISDTNYKLVIEDTGTGFPPEKVEKKSIGLELVTLLVLQLKGKLTIESKNGTVFEIFFSIV